jgi:hypothetical protein
MKKIILSVVLAVVLIVGLVAAYLEMRQERDSEAAAEAPVMAPSRIEVGAGGATVVKLDAETQKRIGLRTVMPAPGSVPIEFPATARVLDGASLAAVVNEILSARSALETARADYERKKKLFESGQNASASAVEQAEGLLKQQQLAVQAGRDRMAATWGQSIAGRNDLPAFAQLLLQHEAALVRIESLPTDKLPTSPAGVRLFRQSGEGIAAARILGPAPAVDSTVAGSSFLCLVTTNAAQLVPGSALLARLETGVSERGTVLPRGAVVRHAGLGWAYVQTGPDTFTRRAVALDRPTDDGWLVNGEWTKPVVVAGAQSLLSEELKGSIQMRD